MKKVAIALGTSLLLAIPTIGQADASTANVQVHVKKVNQEDVRNFVSNIENGSFSFGKNLSQEQVNQLVNQFMKYYYTNVQKPVEATPKAEAPKATQPAPKVEAPKAKAPAPKAEAPKATAPTPAKPAEKQPAPAATTNTAASEEKQFAAQVLDLVNVERQKAGLNPVQLDEQVASVATKKSEDMRDKNYFSHTSPTYGSPFDMMKQFGVSYRSAGENIAAGQRTPEEVMKAWMNSPGHKANILSSNFTHLGVGVAKGGSYGVYWTQMFIGK